MPLHLLVLVFVIVIVCVLVFECEFVYLGERRGNPAG